MFCKTEVTGQLNRAFINDEERITISFGETKRFGVCGWTYDWACVPACLSKSFDVINDNEPVIVDVGVKFCWDGLKLWRVMPVVKSGPKKQDNQQVYA